MSLRLNRRHHLPALIWSLVVAALLLTPGDQLPESGVWDWVDKPLHAALFAVHCGLLARSLAVTRIRHRALAVAVPASSLYALALETGQIQVAGRSWEWLDLVAGFVGIACAALLIARSRARLLASS